MVEIGYIILGLAAGILSGMFGIGGGIVMVPSLIAFFGIDILDANATSLAAMLLPVGILGVFAYHKAGLINIRKSLWIAIGLFIGSFGGGELAVHISEELLAKFYVCILVYIALGYFDFFSYFKKKKAPESLPHETVSRPFWMFILVGIGAGVFAGLFGKGGGIIIVPLLVGLFHYNPKAAAATSLAALQLPVGLPSVLIYANEGHLNILYSALIALGILAGALWGSKLAVKLPSKIFRKIFATFLLVVAAYLVLDF